ncbi:MAG: TIGR04282 family arsenosugar biosynthesis glycosyltransferase [Desulfobaccales bacterium]
MLIIFAKEPRPGLVKTRLSPPLSPEEATQLYHSFLQDIVAEMARVPEMNLALAYSPSGARDFFRRLTPPGADLFPQEGKDLGERMARACARGLAAGFGPVLLRGGDVPDLPGAVVAEAREVLAAGRAQVVLGPAMDGGYYLVGLAEPQPGLFRGPAWSSRTVLTDTLRLAEELGLKVHLLPAWPDIDTYADLLAFLGRAHPAPHPGWRSHREACRLLELAEGRRGAPTRRDAEDRA